MPKCIWKKRNGGHLVGYTVSICATRCLCMQPLCGRRNVTGQSTMARGSSHLHEASMRRLLPWRVLMPTSPRKRSRACSKRCTSFRDNLVGAIVKGPWKSDSERKSWPPLGSTFDLECHWRMMGNICCLPHFEDILELSTTIPSVKLTRDLQLESRAETTRCWPSSGMPTKKLWLQPLSLRRGLKG